MGQQPTDGLCGWHYVANYQGPPPDYPGWVIYNTHGCYVGGIASDTGWFGGTYYKDRVIIGTHACLSTILADCSDQTAPVVDPPPLP